MQIKIYNSLTNKIEDFKPLVEGEISMYVCGPTVYNYPHIGNARPVVVFDIFRRFFKYLGYNVKFVSNLTDVDDKIINQAIIEGSNEKDISEKYASSYFKMVSDLNATPADIIPRVTKTMDKIINFIDDLKQKDYAYEVNGDVYFRVNKLEKYGVLANFQKEDLLVGARVEENKDKESPLDFALWKKTTQGIKWDSHWSGGRPGWHSECVVMIKDNFNNQKIDIHGGGNDLKFPHHENEIAQSVALDNHQIANFWIHNGMICVDNQKMSKSLGNFRLAKDLIEEYGGNVIRMNLLSAPYRSPVNFSIETLEASKREVDKIIFSLKSANLRLQVENYQSEDYDHLIINQYLEFLADDLNIANALSVVSETVKKLNQYVRSNDLINTSLMFNTLLEENKILGIKYDRKILSLDDLNLYQKWEKLKKEKKFEEADQLRKELLEKDIL